jgi:hypothetical protein
MVVTAEMSASSLNPAIATRSNHSNICAILPDHYDIDSDNRVRVRMVLLVRRR